MAKEAFQGRRGRFPPHPTDQNEFHLDQRLKRGGTACPGLSALSLVFPLVPPLRTSELKCQRGCVQESIL